MSTLGTVAASKLLVSIFSALNPVCKEANITEDTPNIVKKHLSDIGFDIELPLKIKLADDYAEIFAHVMGEVNDDALRAYASEKSEHAANFGASNGSEKNQRKYLNTKIANCSEKIDLAQSVVDDMEKAHLIKVLKPFVPIVR